MSPNKLGEIGCSVAFFWTSNNSDIWIVKLPGMVQRRAGIPAGAWNCEMKR